MTPYQLVTIVKILTTTRSKAYISKRGDEFFLSKKFSYHSRIHFHNKDQELCSQDSSGSNVADREQFE